jgi:uncharacterized protein (UPF0276 family)
VRFVVRVFVWRGLRGRLRGLRLVIDRVGLGYRPELAASILCHADRIDVLEVVTDGRAGTSRRELRALRTLASQVPTYVHGVALGLASASPVHEGWLDGLARVVDAVRPVAWSEHLAFVRAGELELGHLAVPPRTAATVAGAARNLERARVVVGSLPVVENVATLLEPPGSTLEEVAWVRAVAVGSNCGLLLDLHNLVTNARNTGGDPFVALTRWPLERVELVHVAGGRPVATPGGPPRWLDDHLHDIPDIVYALVAELAARAPGPLTVLYERDGAYPPFPRLLSELDRLRVALAEGRARAAAVGQGA